MATTKYSHAFLVGSFNGVFTLINSIKHLPEVANGILQHLKALLGLQITKKRIIMDNNSKNNGNLIGLEKAFTFFMVPFYYKGAGYKIKNAIGNPSEAMWEEAKEKILNEDDDVLFPYIINFLQGKISGLTCNSDHLDIYSINSNPKSAARKFWDAFAQKPEAKNVKKEHEKDTSLHSTDIEIKQEGDNQKIKRTIKFNLIRDNGYAGLKSPHLFISPSANIGILTFCIGLSNHNRTIDDLKQLNYVLHKISKPTNRCITPSFQLKKQVFPNEWARISKESKIVSYRQLIAPHEDVKTNYSPYEEFSWNIRTLINMLIADVKGIDSTDDCTCESDVKLFSETRSHLFTFCQINGTTLPYEYDDIKLDLMRLSRCVNDKYMLSVNENTEKEMCLKTFGNIFFASSVEGASMIAIAKEENEDFVKQIDNQGLPRYLAIYLLVLMQRYSMQQINRLLTGLSAISDEVDDTQLWSVLNIIKKVKVHCYYTDVSPYSQHNQFYQHCNKNLHVRETFNEIDDKTQILNTTINHKVQTLIDKQQKRQNRAEHKAEKGQRRLNLVVGVLTVFQMAQAIYSFTEGTCCYQFWATTYAFLIGFWLLYIVMRWYHKKDWIIIPVRTFVCLIKKWFR